MKLAVSNIAWPLEFETECLEILKSRFISHLEIAPTKYWVDLNIVSGEQITNKRNEIEKIGMSIISAQSLLFGKPEMKVFGSDVEVNATFEYLKKVVDICSSFGCKALVFGSPKNRLKGNRSFSDAVKEAKPLFQKLGTYCESKGTTLCIEPNAVSYGCDFVTNVDEAIQLVSAVATRGFGLHLDTGNMIMAGEKVSEAIEKAADLIHHFHISAPYLTPVSALKDHLSSKDWITIGDVRSCLSIEMLIKEGNIPQVLDHNIQYVNQSLGLIP